MAEVFVCPRCGGGLQSAAGGVACSACAAPYRVERGVLDLVEGQQGTRLDDLDYDAFYAVGPGKVLQTVDLVRRHTGSLLDGRFDEVLEIGAGTGLLTAGLAEQTGIRRLVVTDVSHKMLARCRERLQSGGVGAAEILYATSDAGRLALSPGRFDAVFGYFVLHHVADYRRTLADLGRATTERGVAVFVEPSARFHRAMVLTLTRTIERLLPDLRDEPGSDLAGLLNLNNEWEYLLRHAGNVALMGQQEDKHFFERAEFERAGRDAGWVIVDTLPMDPEPGPIAAAQVYASQLGLSARNAARFVDRFASELPGPFALLDTIDAAPSYVFLLAKRPEERASWSALLPASVPTEVRIPPPVLGYEPHYDLHLRFRDEPPYVDVEGWIATTRPVLAVVVEAPGLSARVSVGTRRSDVLAALRHVEAIPFVNAYHSGLRTLEVVPSGPLSGDVGSVVVSAELDDGHRLRIAERLVLQGRGERRGRIHRFGTPPRGAAR